MLHFESGHKCNLCLVHATSHSAETVCAFDAMHGTFGLAAVTVVLFLLLLLLTTILVIVCIKSKLNAGK